MVRDVDDRFALVLELADDREQLGGLLARNTRGWLVKDDDLRAGPDDLDDLDDLLDSEIVGGQFARDANMAEAEPLQALARFPVYSVPVDQPSRLRGVVAENDVFGNAQAIDDAQFLINDPDPVRHRVARTS